MKTLQVGELKSKFSQVIDDIKHGEEIAISFGKKKETIAVIVPIAVYKKKRQRKLGILENKASYKMSDDFSISDDELLDI
ncbi:MAG: prevent-host-death protein [bacterium]|nr:prevent-host-death protein [bacterium]